MTTGVPDIWEVTQSDVLVIGGGFGGLWAALRAAECGSSVLLVEKSFAGKCGHSNFASGIMMTLLPCDDLNDYVYDIATGNNWIVDQEMVSAVFRGSYDRLKDLESFGVPFRKTRGEYVWTKARGTRNVKNFWLDNATASDEITILRNVALSRGVRIMDHTYIYDLVKDKENQVAGAVGVGVRKAHNVLLKAKSVVLATNSGSYRGHHLACELQGTGPFMAYDAGAKLKNPEFHYINIRPAKHEIEGSGIFPAIGGKWTNAKGLHFMEKYDPVLKDRASSFKVVLASAMEALKGNAPISIDVEGMTEEQRERFRTLMLNHGWMPILFQKCEREEGYNPLYNNIEWQPAYESNKLGISADIECKTTLGGLFAAGMARTLGINPFTGWSIASCIWSGYTAGESASRYAENTDMKALHFDSLAESHKTFFEPLQTASGEDPDHLVSDLQKVLFPATTLLIMNETHLKAALKDVLMLKEERLPNLGAADIRTLIKIKEAQTMVLSAEMTLQAALMREETRENIFYREDFQAPDNKNWLKWITAEKGEQGDLILSKEDIPFDKYPFRPDAQETFPAE